MIIINWYMNLDLKWRHVAHGKSEHTADSEREPKVRVPNVLEIDNLRVLAEQKNERNENDARVKVVVHGETPDVVLDHGEGFFGVNSVERNERTR